MGNTIDKMIDEIINQTDFSEETKQKAASVIIDTLIAILYGLKTETEVQNLIYEKQSSFGVALPGINKTLNNRDALIALGTAAVANELDEGNTFAKGHPSAHIFPAVYVTAIENDYTIEQIIDAYIKGYEIAVRLSSAFQMKDNMHPHGTWGNAGGAAARAILLGKKTEEIILVVKLALSLPLATNWLAAEKGQTVRNLYTGYGSLLAYDTVDLAGYGFQSNDTVVSDLWINIMGNNITEDKMMDNLMNPPMIVQNYFKVYPTCRFTHASIEAAENILKNNDISSEDIKNIEIQTYNLAARCNTENISTRLESKFSIPYAVSCIILDLNLYDNYEKNLNEIGSFINKVKVIDSEVITALLPEKRAAKCIITTKDNIEFSSQTDNAKGEFTHPFTHQELTDKYMNMLNHYKVFDEIWLEQLKNIDRNITFKTWLKNNGLLRS
ncbi:2-methylcitrate dehydratase PrpD [Jeotgalicoccus aerolatus]|uniref:2-methylcitrate dehydratase PrpD n=1 Tax=Jeotgalicoccus aerolatus TaxID=709510 RepID=A0A1G9DFP3_9STAP|nr:MmgE/PrpD family protein [Jeotgalicoccus aerolatus]SDK62614.1 2-methylcitrate dehydratase PrpD [Jeotgalicoccus aerolatus]